MRPVLLDADIERGRSLRTLALPTDLMGSGTTLITVPEDGCAASSLIPPTGTQLVETIRALLPETRNKDGCQGVEVTTNLDNADNLVVVEQRKPWSRVRCSWKCFTFQPR